MMIALYRFNYTHKRNRIELHRANENGRVFTLAKYTANGTVNSMNFSLISK